VPKLREYQHNEYSLTKELKKAWESFCLFRRWVSRLFHHHNKKIVNVARSDGKNEHTDAIGVHEFQGLVYVEFKRKILLAIQSLWADVRLHAERSQKLPLLASVFSLMEEILYTGSLERKDFFDRAKELVVLSSEQFFGQKLEEWGTDDCGSYFEMVARVSEEEEEVLKLITRNCEELFYIAKALRQVFYEKLLVSSKKSLASSPFGFSHLVATKSYPVDPHHPGAAPHQEALLVVQGRLRLALRAVQEPRVRRHPRNLRRVHQAGPGRAGREGQAQAADRRRG